METRTGVSQKQEQASPLGGASRDNSCLRDWEVWDSVLGHNAYINSVDVLPILYQTQMNGLTIKQEFAPFGIR